METYAQREKRLKRAETKETVLGVLTLLVVGAGLWLWCFV